MAEKVKVTGVKWFVGEIDGKKLDSGTIFIEERLDDRRGTAKGYAATPYKSLSKTAIELSRNEMPVICEVEFERMTTGKGDSENVIAQIAPVSRAQQAPQSKVV